jgi:hypothetical protein
MWFFVLDCLVSELSEMDFTAAHTDPFCEAKLVKPNATVQISHWMVSAAVISSSEDTGLCLVGRSGLACRIGVVEGPKGIIPHVFLLNRTLGVVAGWLEAQFSWCGLKRLNVHPWFNCLFCLISLIGSIFVT